ncbi:MAG: class I SAM-dependent methyltransferase [Tissierellia bacterium]|nr:class I SAM-dependent methyltransferase [Tissierellia bacterium]
MRMLIQYDFSRGLPAELENKHFDYIISTYAMHHLEDEDKIRLISKFRRPSV